MCRNFRLVTNSNYINCNLSNVDKNILCNIGLPYMPLDFLQFNINEIDNLVLNNEYIVIGNDLGTNICINNKGEIVSVDLENEFPMRFLNKNLESLLKYIFIFILYENLLVNVDDVYVSLIIEELKSELNIIDDKALSDDENWWSIILEQMEL